MFKSVIFAAAAVVLPAAAHASDARQFSHEGVNYVYTSEQNGETTVIKGRTSAGEPFRLFVKGDLVTGTFNNRSVKFATTDAAGANKLAGN